MLLLQFFHRLFLEQKVTEVCLGCICEAVSGCNTTLKCTGDVCGLFRITWPYWADSGKPTQQGDLPTDENAYANCVNEPYCAARAVQSYMTKFGQVCEMLESLEREQIKDIKLFELFRGIDSLQDCNNDGQINCYDHAAIHLLGGYGCSGEISQRFKQPFERCLQQVKTQYGQ